MTTDPVPAPLWRTRLPEIAGGVLFIVTLMLGLTQLDPAPSLLIAFDVGAVLFLALSAASLLRADGRQLPEAVRARDEGRITVLIVSLVLVGAVFSALTVELSGADLHRAFGFALAIGSLCLLWLFFNFSFAVHYAHLYYDSENGGGIAFPGETPRSFWDFLYFAFTIGMTFQVSDTAVQALRLRRLVLVHGILSFAFNVLVLAVAINLAASLLG